jgi:hypothetical protein
MIKVGHKGKAKYWGSYEVLKVAQLKKPIPLHSKELGDVMFKPALVKIKWEDGSKEFWCCPYWIGPSGKERFAQYAAMVSERALSGLLLEAIEEDFFSRRFLVRLAKVIEGKL